MILELSISAFALLIAEAPTGSPLKDGSIASAAVLAPTNAAACANPLPLLAEHPVLPDGERWEVDPRFGVEMLVEALTPFPSRAKKKASWAVVLSCRARSTNLDERPARQWAVLVNRRKQGIEIEKIVPAGDEASRVEAVVPFIADVDGNGSPELGLKGTIVEERGPERVEGDADIFVFFPTAKRIVVHKRVKRTVAGDDGKIARSGIAERAYAKNGAVAIDKISFDAVDEAALDRWWEESSIEDVIGSGGQRTIAQTSDGEATILEGERSIVRLPFHGRIARIVRDRNHLYAAVYVAEQADTRELYLIDLTTERVRKMPRREGEEIALWAWSLDGSYAVYSASAQGPMFVCSMKELEAWIQSGAMSNSEVRVRAVKGSRIAFVRWTSNESFELDAGGVHHRWDVRANKATRLYDVPGD